MTKFFSSIPFGWKYFEKSYCHSMNWQNLIKKKHYSGVQRRMILYESVSKVVDSCFLFICLFDFACRWCVLRTPASWSKGWGFKSRSYKKCYFIRKVYGRSTLWREINNQLDFFILCSFNSNGVTICHIWIAYQWKISVPK